MISKLQTVIRAFKGLLRTIRIDSNSIPKLKPQNRECEIIVSLTSYGRRVHKTVYYTLVSILKQTVQPDKIILWLDNSWNNNLLPDKLKYLITLGVDIRYCNDTRSYKKLLPSLEKYPDAIIITIDDDIYYSPFLIEFLLNGYFQNGNIQCTEARKPIGDDLKFSPYKEWPRVEDSSSNDIMPIGVGGVLYPPGSLSQEVVHEDYLQLAPQADDLWFWVMAKRNHYSHSFIPLKNNYLPFDAIYQFLHNGSALTHNNKGENKNDIQLRQILSKYPFSHKSGNKLREE